MAVDPPSHQFLFSFITLLFLILDGSYAFCPYLSSSSRERQNSEKDAHDRVIYDQTCSNNCFMNDRGNIEAYHQASDGSTLSTFDIMSELSEDYGGSDMCVFSSQELR